jgi:Zn-dependent peptidase ImmA (M78 family)/transcriptional regulator with XRE-family HTH domain
MSKINHKMIQLARESRGYTQTELAEKMNVPQGNLSRMERGDIGVKSDHLKTLSEVLKYPTEFFYMTNQICTTDTHYRKRISIDQRTKLKAEAIMNIYKFNVEEMLKSLEIINNVPVVSQLHDSPEKMARYLRSYWKIPKGPVDNLSKIVEDNGIIIIKIDFETDKIDGRTIITDTGHPIIFLNSNLSGDRERLTLAHEKGHVVLHVNAMPAFTKDEEDEAFRYGIEFMMPFNEVEYEFNDKLSLEKLADLKRIYKISMQAILYFAQREKLVNYNRCRYLWAQISAKGWKKVEPIEIPKESPTILTRMAKMFTDQLEYSKDDLANILKLNVDEVESRYFKPPPKLRVA